MVHAFLLQLASLSLEELKVSSKIPGGLGLGRGDQYKRLSPRCKSSVAHCLCIPSFASAVYPSFRVQLLWAGWSGGEPPLSPNVAEVLCCCCYIEKLVIERCSHRQLHIDKERAQKESHIIEHNKLGNRIRSQAALLESCSTHRHPRGWQHFFVKGVNNLQDWLSNLPKEPPVSSPQSMGEKDRTIKGNFLCWVHVQ